MFNIGLIEFLIILFFAVLLIKPKDFPTIVKNLGLFYRNIERYFNNLKYEFSQIEIDIEDKIIKNKNEIHRPSKRIKKKSSS